MRQQSTTHTENQESLQALDFSYPNKDGEMVQLSQADHDLLVDKIVRNFTRFDKAKSSVRRRWKKTEKAVKGVTSYIESERSAGLVPYGKQSHQTLISHFWGRSLQTDSILFSVYGKDEQSKNNAPTQKEFLLEILKTDGFQQKMDDGVDDALMKGVIVGHVSYSEAKQTIQVLSGHKGTTQETDPETGEIQFTQLDETTQDSATLTIVDPENFVFDTSNHENWDACFKAYQSFKVYEDIAANPEFSNYEDLENLEDDKASNADKYFPKAGGKNKQRQGQEGVDEEGKIELIEFHGDIRMPDGSYVRNWSIIVAGRQNIIFCKQNPLFINPFVKWTYERTKDGWGLAPLDYIVSLIEGASTVMNTSVEAGKLAINPPILAPKGMLPQKRLYLMEGRVIEYEVNPVNQNHMPTPMQLNTQVAFPFLQLFETQCEATTGATRQLSGNVTSNDNSQTATEFQGLQVVGNLILDRVVDRFNIFFKCPLIQKMALVTAMFNPQPGTPDNPMMVEVPQANGLKEHKPVTPEVMYGNYKYIVEDNKSEIERKQNTQQKIQMFEQILADPELNQRAKKIEMVTTFLRDMSYEDAAGWFMTDDEMVQKALKDEAIKEQVMLMVGQMQQQARQQMLIQEGIDPNAIPATQTGPTGALGPAGPVPPSAAPAPDAGMGAIQGASPPAPGQPPGLPVSPAA